MSVGTKSCDTQAIETSGVSVSRPSQRKRTSQREGRQFPPLTREVENRVALVDAVPVVHVETPPPAAAPRILRATLVGRGVHLDNIGVGAAGAAGGFRGGLEGYPPPSAQQCAQPHHRVLHAKEPVGFR